MARKLQPPALIGAPYHPPLCRVGSSLVCQVRGRLIVQGMSDAPIPWPVGHTGAAGCSRMLIVCDDLARAVRTETANAVAHHWGVGRQVVYRWRRALGVGRMTPGTLARWQELVPSKLTAARRRKGGRNSQRGSIR